MTEQVVKDIDGATYRITWADDERSADVTCDNEDRLCLIYAARRGGHTVWFTTESSDAYQTPLSAITAVTAAMRIVRKPAPAPVPQKPRKSWRDLVDTTLAAREAPKENKWHHRADWD